MQAFEKVIAARLIGHLTHEGPDLADYGEYGFQAGRLTIDAILSVKADSEEVTARGEVLMAVLLDIANAFNTVLWSVVREALAYHRVTLYLRRLIGDDLRQRYVTYQERDGGMETWEMVCGVPQGSLLGPLLRSIGYDWVLRGALLSGVKVVCYADDTLITARGAGYREPPRLATAGVAQVVRRIRDLGLEVALEKSETLLFRGSRVAPPPGAHIVVSGVRIEVKTDMRYLGLVLDSRWDICEHFRRGCLRAPALRLYD